MKQARQSTRRFPWGQQTVGAGFLTAVVCACTWSAQATLIVTEPTVGGTLFPSSAEVIASTTSDGSFADSANTSLAQTFQSPGFDLLTIYVRYVDADGASLTLNIFTVDEVNAAALAEPPPGTGTLLLTLPLALPVTAGGSNIAAIQLDTPLTLPANTGTEGYAVYLGGDTTFEWFRTAAAGDVYPGGAAYENGAPKASGARDFVLALSSSPIPEPSVVGLLLLGAAFLARARCRRGG